MSNFNSERAANGVPIKIRPHHGMCIQFFRGEGYSREFVSGMICIITALNAGAVIELTDQADSICALCPNNCGGVCSSADKVAEFDAEVLRLCGLNTGRRISWTEFEEAVRQNIIANGKIKSVCEGCQWAYICHENIKNAELK